MSPAKSAVKPTSIFADRPSLKISRRHPLFAVPASNFKSHSLCHPIIISSSIKCLKATPQHHFIILISITLSVNTSTCCFAIPTCIGVPLFVTPPIHRISIQKFRHYNNHEQHSSSPVFPNALPRNILPCTSSRSLNHGGAPFSPGVDGSISLQYPRPPPFPSIAYFPHSH